ncbi:MAG: hypothetical protein QOF60_2093, partial [Actinomycetota bacterium]|nr:hypothetical protein [Actinomycetota bacterium]
FDELPGRALRVEIDRNVSVAADAAVGDAVNAGSAVEFVEAVTGRAPLGPTLARFPVDVAAQLQRARQIL